MTPSRKLALEFLEWLGPGYSPHAVDKLAEMVEGALEGERERIAVFIENFTPTRAAFTTEDEGGITWPHEAVQLPIYTPERLVAAIRNTPNPKETP